MGENDLIKDFDAFSKAKKQNASLSKMIIIACLIIVISVLIWGFAVTNNAMNKIIVVERSGEYLKISAENSEQLFVTLVQSTCAHLTHYANSFDRLSINENQAKATLLCDKGNLSSVFELYKQEGAYHEVLERGVVYRCEIEKVTNIGNTEPYAVSFSSILTYVDGSRIVKFRIYSEGTLIKVKPQFPENTTGFFFNTYRQSIKNIDDGQAN